jgi:hypothetical protein
MPDIPFTVIGALIAAGSYWSGFIILPVHNIYQVFSSIKSLHYLNKKSNSLNQTAI